MLLSNDQEKTGWYQRVRQYLFKPSGSGSRSDAYTKNPVTQCLSRVIFTKTFVLVNAIMVIVLIVLLGVHHETRNNITRSNMQKICSVIQVVIFIVYALRCLAVGLYKCIHDTGIVFETIIIIICAIDCFISNRAFSYYASLNVY